MVVFLVAKKRLFMEMIKEQDPTYVLLAEDDDDDYLIFSLALEEIAIRVSLKRAKDGEILMQLLQEKNPDLLFLDLLMPCKDGRQCIREIRANSAYDSVPIIVYSSLNDLKEIEFCYREGTNLFAVKPNSIGDLKSILERILSINWKQMLFYPTLSQFVIKA
ncbi:response regulator [Deminuibacter soli]|uniref:Response regulator n=2 Tax=Deminuibacter soli TaxID=2291815 RepID=A0A3E1NDE9_9BACT|nr:response regulator [Deminuibacter soli]